MMSSAKAIMFQGTASHVGKSVLVAALCRILREDGYRVAPFKAQNMALNSFVTTDGGEIGRAQAFQAEAAGIEPTVDMNPILLKPTSDTGAQVIIHGKVYGNMKASDYHKSRKELMRYVLDSYSRLAKRYEVIVIEGAGSPAEINLRENDIANMGLAEEVDAPVILIGDIDRGGVFASLVGTMELLSPSEKKSVKGFIINKFRGDLNLLEPGLRFLENSTGKPVLGVIPYLKDIYLPEEDGVALEIRGQESRVRGQEEDSKIKIAIIKLPRISNFTDFDAFRFEPDVTIQYVESPEGLKGADVLIIPGSKNTLKDLQWLWKTGLAEVIIEYAEKGGRVVGICGGFQMLGRVVKDPYKTESSIGEAKGLGLLDVETILEKEKKTAQVEAVIQARGRGQGARLEGYEIHMGETAGNNRPFSVITNRNGNPTMIEDGAVSEDGSIWGTYIHGIFDNDMFRVLFLNKIRASKGLPMQEAIPFKEKKNEGIKRLAEVVSKSVDMHRFYSIIGQIQRF